MTQTTGFRRRVWFTLGAALLIVVAAWLSWRLAHTLLLLFAGVLVGILLTALAKWVQRRSSLEWRAALATVIVGLLLILVGAGWLIGPRIGNQLAELQLRISQPLEQVESWLDQYGWGSWVIQQTPGLDAGAAGIDAAAGTDAAGAAGADAAGVRDPDLTDGRDPQNRTGVGPETTGAVNGAGAADGGLSDALGGLDRAFGALGSVLSTIISVFADAFFVIFVGIFLAANPSLYRKGILNLIPPKHRERGREVLDELYQGLTSWLVGQLISMLIIGVLAGIGLALLGVPLVFALAFIAFLTEFIPIVGPWLGAIPAVLLALTQGPFTALWVALLFFVIQQLEGDVIYPLVLRRTVDLPPVVTLFAVFALGALFGFVGVLVAAPLAVVVMVLIKMLYVRGKLHTEVPLPSDR